MADSTSPLLSFEPVEHDPFAMPVQRFNPVPSFGGQMEGVDTTPGGIPAGGLGGLVATDAAAHGAQSAADLATAPHDALYGTDTPQNLTNRAIQGAGLLVGQGLAGPSEGVGIFGGKGAATADLGALASAQKLEGNGEARSDIFQQTGWFRGADGHWRFEIPDHQAALKGQPSDQFEAPVASSGPAQTMLDHPELFSAYPNLRNSPVNVSPADKWGGGNNSETGEITADAPTQQQALSVLLHEFQHSVQGQEGFSPGSNIQSNLHDLLQNQPQMNIFDAVDEAGNRYQRAAGETEARNVQLRSGWSPQDRREMAPWLTEDTPRDQQIVLTPLSHDPFTGQQPADASPLISLHPVDHDPFQ